MFGMKRRFVTGIVMALLLAGLGCASNRRMFSRSPFGNNENQASSDAEFSFDSREVNLWPLLYANKNFLSICWPVFDIDQEGMAVRPFYNRSGDEYSVLFPLAAWNPVNQDGWIVPAYWNLKDDSYGFFPFYLHNRYSDSYLLFFLLRDNDGERAGCGLLPLAYYSRKGGYFAIFWYKNNFQSWGVFPLIWRSPNLNVVFPAFWSYDENGQIDGGGLLPLTYFDRNWGYFATYWHYRGKNFRSWGVFPLVIKSESQTETNWTFLWPLLYFQLNKAENSLARFQLWPFFGYHSFDLNLVDVNKNSVSVLTPLFLYREWPQLDFPESFPLRADVAELTSPEDFNTVEKYIREKHVTSGFWGYIKRAEVEISELEKISEEGDEKEKIAWSDIGFPQLPMLYRQQALGEEYRWHGPGSFDFSPCSGYHVGEKKELQILQFLYRYHRQGDREQSIFFPGCNFVRQGNNTRFSFWYRVWEYQVKDGEISGYFLFIPFGNSASE